MKEIKRIAVIGPNTKNSNKILEKFAFKVGEYLMDNGFMIIFGGMHGVMEATAKGANYSKKFNKSRLLAFLPSVDSEPNKYSMTKIFTSLKEQRNHLLVHNSDAVIAIGGGAGTLNEITIAWMSEKTIIGFVGGGGWSEKLAGTKIDNRSDNFIIPIKDIFELDNCMKEI